MSNTLSQVLRDKLSQKRQKVVSIETKLDTLEKYELMINSLVVENGVDLSIQFYGYTKDSEFEKPRTTTTKLINLSEYIPLAGTRIVAVMKDELAKKLNDLEKEIELL